MFRGRRRLRRLWYALVTVSAVALASSAPAAPARAARSEEHTSELQSHHDLVCRLLLEKKKENPKRGRNARQLLGAVHLAVVHVETNGIAAVGDGLTQTIQYGIQSLIEVEPVMRTQTSV